MTSVPSNRGFSIFWKGGEAVEMEHPLTSEVSETVSRLMREMQFGYLTLTVQDGRVIQLERNEKFRFPDSGNTAVRFKSMPTTNDADRLPRLKEALEDLRFGQVIVKVQGGRIVQLDRTEKRRWADLMGVGGDGI